MNVRRACRVRAATCGKIAGISLAAAVVAGLLLVAPGVAHAASPAYVQGSAFSTNAQVPALAFTTRPVQSGDLLVGWFAQQNGSGQVQVSDNVNGGWTRAPASTSFLDGRGDIALYYRAASKPAPSGLTITVRAGGPARLSGTFAEYSGLALSGSLDQVVSGRGVGTSVNTGSTAPVKSGELVYSAVVTKGNPGKFVPGSSQGKTFAPRVVTSAGSAYEQDIVGANAGSQNGAVTLDDAAAWYAVAATFRPLPPDSQPTTTTTPTGTTTTSPTTTTTPTSTSIWPITMTTLSPDPETWTTITDPKTVTETSPTTTTTTKTYTDTVPTTTTETTTKTDTSTSTTTTTTTTTETDTETETTTTTTTETTTETSTSTETSTATETTTITTTVPTTVTTTGPENQVTVVPEGGVATGDGSSRPEAPNPPRRRFP